MNTAWLDRNQVVLYVSAILVGCTLGWAVPSWSPLWEAAVTPLLVLVITLTFLGIPLAQLVGAVQDVRFLLVLLGVNFVVAPLCAVAISLLWTGDPGLRVGMLLVLLAPCIDYVVVFTARAGGDRVALLAATPVLLLVQFLVIPLVLLGVLGGETVAQVDVGGFVSAFVWMIVTPLIAAALLRAWAVRRARIARALAVAETGMVPAMVLVLVAVSAAQFDVILAHLDAVATLIPGYVLFAVCMTAVAVLASRRARLSVPKGRAVVFSAVTRNSLVILPIALALSETYPLAPAAVVCQTLVELVLLAIMVEVVPRLLPDGSERRTK